MNLEAKKIIHKLQMTSSLINDKINHFSCEYKGHFITLSVMKKINKIEQIGYIPSCICTTEIIKTIQPDLILNLGTAGGIKKKGVELKDLVLADYFSYHDHFMPNYFKEYSIGKRKCSLIPNLKNTKIGTVSSSYSTEISANSWERLNNSNILAVDMEANAIAEICEFYNIKFSSLKVITDLLDESNNKNDLVNEFITNFDSCMDILSDNIFDYLDSVISIFKPNSLSE